MDASKSSTSRDWLFFLISAVACLALLIFLPAWFWVSLPFVFTFLVRALDMM